MGRREVVLGLAGLGVHNVIAADEQRVAHMSLTQDNRTLAILVSVKPATAPAGGSS